MDKSTRNEIQRATQVARRLLEDAYREQLEGTYDILLDGTIAEQPGSHLSERQKVTRETLIAAVAHKRSAGMRAKEAVDAYLREAAFTTLNRFVALKMLEARDLVQECVSKGEDSSGFKEFTALAPGLVAVDDKGYRLYIETLFDEIGQEVKVLFDRRDVASLLWPDRQTLLELLGILNMPELASVWAEDETIGWVYQYFNGDEERTKMRAESQAPRNSRELAVRNQFFTPRYVVQFLTDNTLGRTWYEMMQRETKLADRDYLVRRPNEVFLADGESAPESEVDDSDLSQEELLQQTVYVPFRAKKDPRDLRILDPACGSGHFLLYAFELLISIYEEAWSDTGAAAFTETGTQLRAEYGTLDALRCAMPELVVRHNLHGVDIDPRAAQIAALALWMRAQRAYKQFEVGSAERLPITKTNIVVAEPMPGDAELVEKFAASLRPAVLGDLFKKMVEEMKLAGELGSLLKIEESLAKAVKDAEEALRQGSLFAPELASRGFWDTAAEKIIAALGSFSESAAGSAGTRRQLFAEDTAQAVAFIELMRQRFDVVLMNPPFGLPTKAALAYTRKHHRLANDSLYLAFTLRAATLLVNAGQQGMIADCTFLYKRAYEDFRRHLVESATLHQYVDLGWGVLDANVEVGLCVIGRPTRVACFRDASHCGDKSLVLRDSSSAAFIRNMAFLSFPRCTFSYKLISQDSSEYSDSPLISEVGFHAVGGVTPADAQRVYRLRWEIPLQSVNVIWRDVHNGSPYSPYYYHLCHAVRSDEDTWKTVLSKSTARVPAREMYGTRGLTYGKRTNLMYAYPMQAGQVFSVEGQALFPVEDFDIWTALALANSSVYQDIVNQVCGQHKLSGYLNQVRLNVRGLQNDIGTRAREIHNSLRAFDRFNEISPEFVSDGPPSRLVGSFARWSESLCEDYRVMQARIAALDSAIQYEIENALGKELRLEGRERRTPNYSKILMNVDFSPRQVAWNHASYVFGVAACRWDVESACEKSRWPTIESEFDTLSLLPPGLRKTCPSQEQESVVENSHGVGVDILADDPGSQADILRHMRLALERLWATRADETESQLARFLSGNESGFRRWLRKEFFAEHIVRYSKSRRKAPIYWQLATSSASYSIWCYYHRLTRDTFFRVANDYVTPKVDHEERKLNALRQEAGHDPSSKQRKALDAQETFVAELRVFAAEVTRIAPLWNPNLNDGVIINFAPLWRLVPQHKPWQKACKACWDKLCKGDYDWAHLAMHVWPERVVPKCQDDRSLAIAHGLEDEFWHEDGEGKWQQRRINDDRIETLVAERASTAVKAALKDLLEAPAAAGQSRRRRRVKA